MSSIPDSSHDTFTGNYKLVVTREALPLRLVVSDEESTFDIIRTDNGDIVAQALKMNDGWDYDRLTSEGRWIMRRSGLRSPLAVLEAAIMDFEAWGG